MCDFVDQLIDRLPKKVESRYGLDGCFELKRCVVIEGASMPFDLECVVAHLLVLRLQQRARKGQILWERKETVKVWF